MSRTGKKLIIIPAGTEISVADGTVTVKGKGGSLHRRLHSEVSVAVPAGSVSVTPSSQSRLALSLWGTSSAHVRNMIRGVTQPFVKKLQIEGIGFKAELSGKTLSFDRILPSG